MSGVTDLEYVRQVLERHRAEILAAYHGVGVGIGKETFSDAGYVITVYLETHRDQPVAATSIEGVPLKFIVTGPFTVRR